MLFRNEDPVVDWTSAAEYGVHDLLFGIANAEEEGIADPFSQPSESTDDHTNCATLYGGRLVRERLEAIFPGRRATYATEQAFQKRAGELSEFAGRGHFISTGAQIHRADGTTNIMAVEPPKRSRPKSTQGVVEISPAGRVVAIDMDLVRLLGYDSDQLMDASLKNITDAPWYEDEEMSEVLFGLACGKLVEHTRPLSFRDRWGRPVYVIAKFTLADAGFALAYVIVPQRQWENWGTRKLAIA